MIEWKNIILLILTYKTYNYMRSQALDWWHSLDFYQQEEQWLKWRKITKDRRKDWILIMIDTSSAAIEIMYKELHNL